MKKSVWTLAACAALGLCIALPVCAEDAAEKARDKVEESIIADDLQARQCVSIRRIDRTEIIDDRNIVFHMQGKDIYLNKLPRRCPGLRISDSFSYRNTTGQLCNVDLISVLDNFGGELRRGPSCGLGEFFPITEDELVVLKNPDLDVEPEATEAEIEEDVDG